SPVEGGGRLGCLGVQLEDSRVLVEGGVDLVLVVENRGEIEPCGRGQRVLREGGGELLEARARGSDGATVECRFRALEELVRVAHGGRVDGDLRLTSRLLACSNRLSQLVETLLSLTRQLLDLDELALDLDELVRKVTAQSDSLNRQGVQNRGILLLDLPEESILRGLHPADLGLQVLEIPFRRAARQGGNEQRDREEVLGHQRISGGIAVISPAVMANSARRFRAQALSVEPSTAGLSFP